MTPNAKICLRHACENLQHTPLSKEDLQIIMDVARFATNNPALRSSVMTALALSSLLRSDTNAFMRAAQIQKKTFPDEPQLLTIKENDYMPICKECQGKGTKVVPCPRCMNPKKKRNQKEVCKMCKGKKEMVVRCYSCKGVAAVFKLSDNVRKNYTDVLAYIAKMCEDAEP